MQLSGLTVLKDGHAVDVEETYEPGVAEIREALAAMARGHHRKALDLLWDGTALYAASKDLSPWR